MRRVLVPLAISPVLPVRASVVRALAGHTMGTSWSARIAVDGAAEGETAAAALQAALASALDQVVAQMSHWEEGSDLCRFNRAAPGSWQRLPEAFFRVLRYALRVAELSGGAYDPCAGALVERWGFGARGRHDQPGFSAPSAAEIAALQAGPRWRDVQLDETQRRALQPGGVQLDLSSVAKGFAVDQLARCLDARGCHHYLVEVGGELRGAGVKPDGEPWWVALEDVPGAQGGEQTVAALHGLALATSGDYRNCYSLDRYTLDRYTHDHDARDHDALDHDPLGQRTASHTIDPRSGYPIDNQVASVSVLHAHCMDADALSTALGVLGPDAGLRLAEQQGLAARFLVRRGAGIDERCSSAYRELLQ